MVLARVHLILWTLGIRYSGMILKVFWNRCYLFCILVRKWLNTGWCLHSITSCCHCLKILYQSKYSSLLPDFMNELWTHSFANSATCLVKSNSRKTVFCRIKNKRYNGTYYLTKVCFKWQCQTNFTTDQLASVTHLVSLSICRAGVGKDYTVE